MFKNIKQIIKDLILPIIDRKGWAYRQNRDDKRICKILKTNLSLTSNCIDIGCHRGDFLKFFYIYAPNGKRFAFEPLPPLFEKLKANFPDTNTTFYNYALSDYEGKSKFNYIVNDPGWSGFKTQSYANKEVEIKEIEVEVKKLDNVIPKNVPIDFIKIDVEGAEHQVLSGALALISEKKPMILFEFAKIHTVNYGVTPDKFYDLFVNKLKMNIFLLNGHGPLSLDEFSEKYETSFALNYGRKAETNFVATYKSRLI
jgi:FkbM family methyltransferase